MFKKGQLVKNCFMKKNLKTIQNVREDLNKMKGEKVNMLVNRGRKKIVRFDAVLVDTYPSVFTVMPEDDEQNKQSFSYTEILCGNVRISPKMIW